MKPLTPDFRPQHRRRENVRNNDTGSCGRNPPRSRDLPRRCPTAPGHMRACLHHPGRTVLKSTDPLSRRYFRQIESSYAKWGLRDLAAGLSMSSCSSRKAGRAATRALSSARSKVPEPPSKVATAWASTRSARSRQPRTLAAAEARALPRLRGGAIWDSCSGSSRRGFPRHERFGSP